MPYTITRSVTTKIPGDNFVKEETLSVEGKPSFSITLAAAKAGSLTTRGSNTAGSITGPNGHGVTDGQRLDLTWINADGTIGRRYGCLVGTVASLVIPISGGAGDNLPILNTGGSVQGSTLYFQVPTLQEFTVTGNNVVGILVKSKSPKRTQVTFADGSSDLLNIVVNNQLDGGYEWSSLSGLTNPLASQTPTKFYLSHDGTSAKDVDVTVLYN